MKLKYSITREAALPKDALIKRITHLLDDKGYLITLKTDSAVDFKDNFRQLRSRWAAFRNVDKGEFRLIPRGDTTEIKLTYYISYLSELIMSAVVIFAGCASHVYYVLLCIIPILIQFGARIDTLKTVSTTYLNLLDV